MYHYMDPAVRLLGGWAGELNAGSVILRICAAFLFSGILGWERAHKLHSAGLRTFILTALAAVSAALMDSCCSITGQPPILSAATIAAVALISGNSFFYSSKNKVKGLTTAAALWGNCLIGLSLGSGFYTAAVVEFAAVFLCLTTLPPVEAYLKEHSRHFEIQLELKNKESLSAFTATVRRLGLRIDEIEANPAYLGSGLSVFSVSFTIRQKDLKNCWKPRDLIEALRALDYVSYLEEI